MTVVLQAFYLVATLLAASIAWSAESLTIVIRPAVNLEEASVASEQDGSKVAELTLAEIVDVATIPAVHRENVVRHLRAVALTDLPGLGEERTFTQEGLETIVAEASRRLEAAGFEVEWKIPRRSHVLRKTVFTPDAIRKQLSIELGTRCLGCEVVIKRLDMPKVNQTGMRNWKISMRSARPRGSFAIPLEIDREDGSRETVMLSGLVEYWSSVPVLSRSVQPGEKILSSDLRNEKRNLSYAYDEPIAMAALDGMVAARVLAAGDAVWKNSVRREQLVRFGDVVRVQSGGDTWSVSTDGIAQGAASLGESVQVRVGKNGKLISGVLKEKGLVEIQ